MFATKKIARLVCLALLAALPIGGGVFQPAAADAAEIIRFGPVVRRPAVVVRPAAPVVRVGPVYARPWYRRWYGYRWWR